MRLSSFLWFTSIILIIGIGIAHRTLSSVDDPLPINFSEQIAFDNSPLIEETWQRPPGPPRVALQVGHWKNNELPDEFARLRETGGGTRGGGKAEWEVNLVIAELTAELLRAEGVIVEILPATIPPSYWADIFVSVHADGSETAGTSGYKVAAPWRDVTGKAPLLASLLEQEYGKQTQLPLDPNITRNMRGYYAFNWRRYDHALHPMTTAAIVETGFLTSPHDQQTLIHQPEVSAQGIANGIMAFINNQQIGAV
ncbi:MAG: N-acetylmuramoyl-L-alanine amidase [Candidatus Andersenbacteria bacterium]